MKKKNGSISLPRLGSAFPYSDQRKYALVYQKWYAEKIGVPVEKILSANGAQFQMVLIPPGRFWMGSSLNELGRYDDETRCRIIISKPYWLGKYEVTQKQWFQITKEKPWAWNRYIKSNPNHAVSYVSQESIQKNIL